MTKLYGLRVADRCQPLHAGRRTGPYHYVLDEAGALVLAAERGGDIDGCRWRTGRALALEKSQHLAHLVGISGFFTALIGESRSRTGCQLVEWRSERSWIASSATPPRRVLTGSASGRRTTLRSSSRRCLEMAGSLAYAKQPTLATG